MKSRPLGLTAIFAIPLVVAILSLIGLVGALLGDGVWDWIGWIGLGACVAVAGWALAARRQR
jgi:xanthosine utilization system XapX-like protein